MKRLRNLAIGFLLVIIAGCTLLPISHLLLRPLLEGNFTSAAVVEPLRNPYILKTFRNTLILSTGTMLFSLAIGLPLAYLLARTNLPQRHQLRTLFMLPYIIPPYIGAIAWIDLANPNVGLLNRLLGTPLLDIYSLSGMIWVLGLFFYTYVLLAVSTALENLDPCLEESARMCGASPLRTAWDIALPLVKPAVLSAAFLVFLAAAAAFGVPYLIGGGRQIPVLTSVIYEKVRTGGMNGIFEASNLSLPLLLLGAVALYALDRSGRGQQFAVVGGRGQRTSQVDLGRWKGVAVAACTLLLCVIVLMPLAAIVVSSFLAIPGRFDSLSLLHYREVFSGQFRLGHALGNSFLLAGSAALIACLIGGLTGFWRARSPSRSFRLLDFCLSLSYATPGIIIALGLILTFSRGLRLTDTLWILLIAYFAKYASFVVRTVRPATQQIDPSLAEAARMCGARPMRRLFTIWLPMLAPALIAGWFLVFMPAFSELTMSILLVGIDTDTIGTIIFRLQDYVNPDAAPVVALLVVLLVIGSNTVTKLLTKGRYGI